MKKVIVIDDEDPARKIIKEYLEDYDHLVLLEECNNGVDAVKAINTFKPDIVFLDIQMPGLNGFEVLQHLETVPKVIFTTAYDQYALKAFEVHAIDYLMKPIKKERFHEAVQLVSNANPEYLSQIQSLVSSMHESDTYLTNILVSARNKLINIPTDEIIWIKAEGNYASLITEKGSYLSSYGISKLEEKMNPNQFIRVHRSTLININYVKEVYNYPSSYEVIMKSGDKVKVSRSYLENIRKLIV